MTGDGRFGRWQIFRGPVATGGEDGLVVGLKVARNDDREHGAGFREVALLKVIARSTDLADFIKSAGEIMARLEPVGF